MGMDNDLLDKLLEGYQKPEDLIGENGLLKQLTKALVERALNAELTHHLSYDKNDPEGRGGGNSRNGGAEKHSKAILVKWRSRFRAIGRASLSPRSWANTSGAAAVSMTRSCRCTRVG